MWLSARLQNPGFQRGLGSLEHLPGCSSSLRAHRQQDLTMKSEPSWSCKNMANLCMFSHKWLKSSLWLTPLLAVCCQIQHWVVGSQFQWPFSQRIKNCMQKFCCSFYLLILVTGPSPHWMSDGIVCPKGDMLLSFQFSLADVDTEVEEQIACTTCEAAFCCRKRVTCTL